LETEVPCLLLQPLVENALQHGIDPQAAGGRLTIVAQRVDDRLEITVRDNGPGFPAGFALQQSHGVGLKNTEARLRFLYGVRQQFEIRQPPGGGAEVRLVLPWRKAVATATAPVTIPGVIPPP
jgi:sensor histidine kinase YesM